VYKAELFRQVQITKKDIDSKDPVDQFVFMEMVAVRNILAKVDDNIQFIRKVLQGTEMLTPQTEAIATQLMKSEVPASWEKQWEGPENPNNWIRLVNKKGSALIKWVQKVQANALLKSPVNLSDLFHPETFLSAFRQRSARLFKVAIDELKLVSSFDATKINREGSIQLEGLWLQGCAFDGTRLADIRGAQKEIQQLPLCSIAWIADAENDPYPSGTVETPVYHSPTRESLLCTFKMANNGEASKRIISGVALFLNGSE